MIEEIAQLLKQGMVGVMPTDTIYGIVGSALNPKTVEEIYRLRKRSKDKPMIILIASIDDLRKFDVKLTDKQKKFLKKNWPNPLSVVLPVHSEKFKYLHRGTNSLAFRMPKGEILLKLLKQTGPLMAPSANFEGGKAAGTINEAKKYFGNKVAFYINQGKIKSPSSTLIKLDEDGQADVLRIGPYSLDS